MDQSQTPPGSSSVLVARATFQNEAGYSSLDSNTIQEKEQALAVAAVA